jgi:hypothetical protein
LCVLHQRTVSVFTWPRLMEASKHGPFACTSASVGGSLVHRREMTSGAAPTSGVWTMTTLRSLTPDATTSRLHVVDHASSPSTVTLPMSVWTTWPKHVCPAAQ